MKWMERQTGRKCQLKTNLREELERNSNTYKERKAEESKIIQNKRWVFKEKKNSREAGIMNEFVASEKMRNRKKYFWPFESLSLED